jgi:hypothetical protein
LGSNGTACSIGYYRRPNFDASASTTYATPIYASLLIQNGESLAYVRDQLGHASIKLTVDTYGHLVPGANRQPVDRLDDAPEAIRHPGATENTKGATA